MSERISTTRSVTSVSDPVNQLCFSKDNDTHTVQFPEKGEYHLLVKQGKVFSNAFYLAESLY